MDWARLRLGLRPTLLVCVAVVAFGVGLASLTARLDWEEVEDGVLWVAGPPGVQAADVAPGTAAAAAGIRPGDVLLAIDQTPIESLDDVLGRLHAGVTGTRLTYSLLRAGATEIQRVTLEPVPQPYRSLYPWLFAIGLFTLAVGLSVSLRRPSDPATLHFFWVSLALYGVLGFSFSGRWTRVDQVFYWADVVALLLVAPLFLHFTLVFPDRSRPWIRGAGRTLWPLLYVPALLLCGARAAAFAGPRRGSMFSGLVGLLDRLDLAYLGVCLVVGLVVLTRALGSVRSLTARRQLRWIVWGTALGALPFTLAYLLPYVLGWPPATPLEFTVIPLALIPLAFASAIVRYRLLDVEVIIKRGLVYAAALAAIAAMYALLLKAASALILGGSERHNTVIALLATLVVVLLARPVKNAIQATLDRAYYRDRYDYRRALVDFARDLNSDLDVHRLSDRLLTRVMETLLVDRLAILLGTGGRDEAGLFAPIRAAGFATDTALVLHRASGIGTRVGAGLTVALDDPRSAARFTAEEIAGWHRAGVHYFVPCVSKEGTIAVLALGRRASGEPLNSEDMALLAAVAGQVATALENGRLYSQLLVKAGELDSLREFSDSIIESLADGLFVVDRDDRVLRWNRTLEGLYGVAREAAIGERLDTLFDPEVVDLLRERRADAAGSANPYRVPLRSRHDGGGRRLLVNAAVAPLRTPDGAITGTIVIIKDVTSQAQLEEQLQISEKMASIGLLAAGVAHEVNTPLTGISSYTQMLLQGADQEDPRTKVLEKIERQTFRAAKIVNGLLNLARPAQVEAAAIDLHGVVNDVLALLDHQFRSANIQVRRDLAPVDATVLGVEHKVQQVFLNLFINARDAMPRGGWLSVTTRQVGSETLVEVADTGSGIPEDYISRIYDPFFTTKPLGQGTGLGLSITYGIVQELGGSITCESTVGQGTRFSLRLPSAVSRQRSGDAAG